MPTGYDLFLFYEKVCMEVENNKPKPDITFSTEEIKLLINYMNFVNTEAEMKLKPPRMQDFIRMTSEMVKFTKKCESYIFEITEHYKAEK